MRTYLAVGIDCRLPRTGWQYEYVALPFPLHLPIQRHLGNANSAHFHACAHRRTNNQANSMDKLRENHQLRPLNGSRPTTEHPPSRSIFRKMTLTAAHVFSPRNCLLLAEPAMSPNTHPRHRGLGSRILEPVSLSLPCRVARPMAFIWRGLWLCAVDLGARHARCRNECDEGFRFGRWAVR